MSYLTIGIYLFMIGALLAELAWAAFGI